MFLIFPVLDTNNLYHFISFVMFLSVRYFELFVICQLCEFDLLKRTKQWNLRNNYYNNWFQLCTVCMYVNRYNTLWGNDFSYKIFSILIIFSKEDHRGLFKFDRLERPSSTVRLFKMATISSFVRIYVNVRGK